MRGQNVAPFGINAGIAAAAVAGGMFLPGTFGTLAGRLLAMQFLVVGSIMMLYVAIWIRRRELQKPDGRPKVPAAIVAVLCCAYLLGAMQLGGLPGVAEFLLLAGGTFLGAWSGERGVREAALVGARGVVAFPALIALSVVFGLPEEVWRWPGASGSVAAAGLYFAVLATAEATPLYPHLATWILMAIERCTPPPRD
jgi:amino acid transporter